MSKSPDGPKPIPFNRPPLMGKEWEYLREALDRRHFAGGGPFTLKCHAWLQERLKIPMSLLTHSCTAALEMAAMLCDLQAGDEVIMPSFTFVSTANAVVLRGAVPVFVDSRADTMNIDEKKIEAAITKKTKAIMPVHYAGVGCEMDTILDIARRHDLFVVEDAAQGLMASYKGQPLGAIGDFGALSFHETKNVVSGEGGALIVKDAKYGDRAEIIREKGTNRRQFLRGQVDKYTWVDIGSSYPPSELLAALLFAQFEVAEEITKARLNAWNVYHSAFADLEKQGRARRPVVPSHCEHNAHIYYLITENVDERQRLTDHLKKNGISAVFHYVPLHLSPGGKKFAKTNGSLEVVETQADQLLRLPMFAELQPTETQRVIDSVLSFYK